MGQRRHTHRRDDGGHDRGQPADALQIGEVGRLRREVEVRRPGLAQPVEQRPAGGRGLDPQEHDVGGRLRCQPAQPLEGDGGTLAEAGRARELAEDPAADDHHVDGLVTRRNGDPRAEVHAELAQRPRAQEDLLRTVRRPALDHGGLDAAPNR